LSLRNANFRLLRLIPPAHWLANLPLPTGWRIAAEILCDVGTKIAAKSRNNSSPKFQLLTAPKHFIKTKEPHSKQVQLFYYCFG
jgi:hypothetical protein